MIRSKIIIEARSWIGTHFHHQGRVKKSSVSNGGCDCIGLIIGVAEALGIKCNGISLADVDNKNYSKIPDGRTLQNELDNYLIKIPVAFAKAGDVLLIKIDKHPQHVAFIGDYENGGLSLIHCFIQARGVVEHSLDEHWREKIVAAYALVSQADN